MLFRIKRKVNRVRTVFLDENACSFLWDFCRLKRMIYANGIERTNVMKTEQAMVE